MLVYEDLELPGDGTPSSVIEITLWGSGQPVAGRHVPTGKLIVGTRTVTPNSQGIWEIDLQPNDEILPENTTWRIERTIGCDTIVSFISVPASGGPYEAYTLEDDPMNAIAPSALSAHASDLQLHGGGLELDYAELVGSNVTVTGTALQAQLVPGLQVTVPSIPRPVYLLADLTLQMPAGATGDPSMALGNRINEDGSNRINAFSLMSIKIARNATPTLVVHANLFARLPPFSPGNYAVYGSRQLSPYSVVVVVNVLQKPSIRAVTA